MNRRMTTLIVLMLLPLAWCASTHPAHVKGRVNPYQAKGRIQWQSSKLKHTLAIDAADVNRTETGLFRVRLAIRNKTRKDIFVDIRTLFTDEAGFEREKTNWEPICCTARTQTQYETVSLGAEVHDYQIIIRDPKDFAWQP